VGIYIEAGKERSDFMDHQSIFSIWKEERKEHEGLNR